MKIAKNNIHFLCVLSNYSFFRHKNWAVTPAGDKSAFATTSNFFIKFSCFLSPHYLYCPYQRISNEFIMKPKVDFCFKELMDDDEVRRGFIAAVLNLPPEKIEKTILLPTHLRSLRNQIVTYRKPMISWWISARTNRKGWNMKNAKRRSATALSLSLLVWKRE